MRDNTINQSVIEMADKNLTIKELWVKTGKKLSLSHIYYLTRNKKLPFKKEKTTRPFKYLKDILNLETKNMTVKQIMVNLKLTTRNDYHCVLSTLKKNSIEFKQEIRNKDIDYKLLEIKTDDMTIDEIAKKVGLEIGWQTNKLYEILPRLGLSYKSRKNKSKH